MTNITLVEAVLIVGLAAASQVVPVDRPDATPTGATARTSAGAAAAAGDVSVASRKDADTESVDLALSWNSQALPAPASGGDTVELVFRVAIADDWVVYASDFEAEVGPQPIRLKLDPGADLELVGPLRSVATKRKTDATWGFEYGYFAGHGEFRQTVRLKSGASRLAGELRGQACFQRDGSCHLFRAPFSIARN